MYAYLMIFKALAFDIEANGFKPTEIFCIATTDLITGQRQMFTPEYIAEGCIHLLEADFLVGHYIRGYDCPVIEKLTQGLVAFENDRLIDTLDMSKALTSRKKHSLKSWGEEFGLPKMASPIFESYSPTMLPYCERDVEITVKLFYHLAEHYIDNPKPFRNHEMFNELLEHMVQHAQ